MYFFSQWIQKMESRILDIKWNYYMRGENREPKQKGQCTTVKYQIYIHLLQP